MKVLTTPAASRTPTRWRVGFFRPIEEEDMGVITVQLLTTGTMLVSEKDIRVRDVGRSDSVAIDPAPVRIADTLALFRESLDQPGAYAAAFDAWRTPGTTAARRSALETWMLAAGVAGANMDGT